LEGQTQLVSLEPETLEDVYETIRIVGRVTGREQEAEDLVGRLCRRIAAVSARLAGIEPRRTVCLEWLDPPYNAGHWTPELVRLAGGEDLVGVPGRPARPMEAAELASVSPDAVVVMACGFGLRRSLNEVDRLKGHLPVDAGQLWVVDGNAYFSRPGPRLVDSVEIMAGILHPDVMSQPPPAAAVRVR
jgi:iron complex transport system substrate-binding protein